MLRHLWLQSRPPLRPQVQRGQKVSSQRAGRLCVPSEGSDHGGHLPWGCRYGENIRKSQKFESKVARVDAMYVLWGNGIQIISVNCSVLCLKLASFKHGFSPVETVFLGSYLVVEVIMVCLPFCSRPLSFQLPTPFHWAVYCPFIGRLWSRDILECICNPHQPLPHPVITEPWPRTEKLTS